MILLAGILAESGSFLVHLRLGQDNQSSLGTAMRRTGALLVGVTLIMLVIGLLAGG